MGCLVGLVLGCQAPPEGTTPATVELDPVPPALRRLTESQYEHTLRDWFGEALYVPPDLEPDTRFAGLISLGTARNSISPRGVEKFEAASYEIAAQVLDDEVQLAGPVDAVVGCAPAATRDDACARTFAEAWGRRLWRRPLEAAELDRLVAIAGQAADTLGDFHQGLEFALAALLQAPDFLMRPELGGPAADGDGAALTAWERASRLAFMLWDAGPDDALLDAAAAGRLDTVDGLRAEAERMVADPRARRGLRAWVRDWAHLDDLEQLRKDPLVFVYMSAAVPSSAEEETIRFFEHLVFDVQADLRDMLTTRSTFVDRTLASIYGIRAPAREGFGYVQLDPGGERLGLLGQVSFLSTHAHPTSTSATERGLFVRESLLCEPTSPPPAGVSTAIPEATPDAPTRRERVDIHLTNPACSGCHLKMDPIGLALENFDGLGVWRDTENGATIDASGELDGAPFDNAPGLARAIREHPHFVPCLVRQVARHALGVDPKDGQQEALDALTARFEAQGHRLRQLWVEMAVDPMFTKIAEVE